MSSKNKTGKLNWKYQKLIDDPEDPYLDNKDPSRAQTKLYEWHVFRIPFRHFIRIVIALPLGSFLFCVFWALYADYEMATTVICKVEGNRPVRNYLPSLSAAIGDFEKSQLFWKLCILIHSPGRFLFASMYLKYLKKVLLPQYQTWAWIACTLHVVENIGLLGLTLITSKQNLPLHALGFAVFIICSEIYMVTLCILLSRFRDGEGSKLELRGLYVKNVLCKITLVSSVLLFMAYFRHEAKCEEGMYTLLALFEYIVVLSNIGFHGSAYWDFYDKIIIIDICEPCRLPVYQYTWDY